MTTDYTQKIKPHYTGYQELHIHTVGSYRDAANTVKDVFDSAEELGRNAVSITDHGNWTRLFEALKERTKREKIILKQELKKIKVSDEEIKQIEKALGNFGSVRNPDEKIKVYIEKYENAFVATAKRAIQFIPGIEMYEGETSPDDTHKYHIVFYAKDWKGAQMLFGLCNLAQLNKHNDMPRCTIDDMKFFFGEGSRGHNHVIATSACMSGHIASILLQPLKLKREIDELTEKQKGLAFVDDDAIKMAEENIKTLLEEVADLCKKVAEAKKIAKKNFDTAILRAQKALDKAMLKSNVSNQLCMDEAYLRDETVIKAKEKLAVLAIEKSKSKNIEIKLPKMIEELGKSKATVSAAKEGLKALKKMNEPVQKIQVKIDELNKTLVELPDEYEEAKSLAIQYDTIFGRGNFFIELQDHGLIEEYVMRDKLIRIAEETGIPLTVANDVHYKNLAAKRKRDIIATLRWPDTMLSDVENHVGGDQLWFKPNEDMIKLFKDVPQAIENTNRIAEACNVFYTKEMHLPEFVDEKDHLSPAKYLKKVAYDNIERCYPEYATWTTEEQEKLIERLEYELRIIEQMGFSSYISIVEDFISFAKRNYTPESVGPGRGSGAGSIVCYLTGITNIDPLRYGLIFERFLNPERVSMPDIDSDFAPSIRENIINYVTNRYASKEPYWVERLSGTVCSITTEGQLAARSAIRQVGKITGVPYSVCDKIAKLIPATVGITLETALGRKLAKDGSDQSSADLMRIYDGGGEEKRLIDDALLVEGTPVQTGVHAAGVIIADKPISEYAPMFWNEKKNVWVIQYDMVACEEDCGLLKMDFLGLRNLDIIIRAKNFVKKTKKCNIDFATINKAEDKNVIANIYANGNTNGVFQFESGGMKKTLQAFSPKSIDDVILLNAAYRPGPMQYIPDVTDVKAGKKQAKYIVPEMANILGSTYGSPIYQEQIQQIFHEIAGFSLGQADIIRRAMSKKHLNEIEAAKSKFTEGFKAKGAKDADIEKFWNELLDFAKYAFNKSHAAAYSVVSFYTAWLKEHYPLEYMASLISFTPKEDIVPYIKETKDSGIKILGPNINRSIIYTAPTKNGEIRFGLDGVKDVSTSASKIIEERKKRGNYLSFEDFIIRCFIAGVDKSTIEALIKSGALDDIVANRQEAAINAIIYLDICRKYVKSIAKNEGASEFTSDDEKIETDALYNSMKANIVFPPLQKEPNYSFDEMLRLEKDYTGFYVSGNPLDKHVDKMKRHTSIQIVDLVKSEKDVTLAGQIIGFTPLRRKSDGKAMCKFILEDLSGTIEAVCFSHSFERLSSQFAEGAVVCLKGHVEVETDENEKVISSQFIIQSGRKLA